MTVRVQEDHIQILKRDDGTTKNSRIGMASPLACPTNSERGAAPIH
jgi:hypothetical protein